MTHRMPPFPAIRAFEAAARHRSFKRAAGELNVTQSAISHQVKALEQYLGVELFRRSPQGVDLTLAGKTYLPLVSGALNRLASATDRVRETRLSGPLTVGMGAAFATRWLVPRLGSFLSAYPSIDLSIASMGPTADFSYADFHSGRVWGGHFDAAIIFGPGDSWPGLRCHRLASSVLYPVCSPELRDGSPPLKKPADLRHHTLLHYDACQDWTRWLEMAGVSGVDASRGPHFEDCNVYFQAVADGHGVGLSLSALAAPDLEAGRIVPLFDLEMMPEAWYHLVYPESSAGMPKLAAFRDWVLDESLFAAAGPPPQAMAS
jgi:LysR family glycine cleavage system transcriptional activator